MLRLSQVSLVTALRQSVRAFAASASDKGGSNASNNNNPSNENKGDGETHPIKRTFNLIRNDLNKVKDFIMPTGSKNVAKDEKQSQSKIKFEGVNSSHPEELFQTHCDVLIIGGGGVGSSIAFWLKEKARNGLNVVVVERDNTYTSASTVLSVGGLRQQFSLPENIEMSLYGADFIRESKSHLGDVELNFTPHGYLVLASEQGAETLTRNSKLQKELGARNELLTAEQLKRKFPWMNTENVALGCHGLEKEGWFDPWALLMGFKQKAREYGAHFVEGDVVDFKFKHLPDVIVDNENTGSDSDYYGLDKAVIRMADGELRTVKFAICIIAAGANSGKVARLAKIGTGGGVLRVPLPVEPRKRFVYVFNTQGVNAPGLATPLTIDPNGTYFRRDGLGGNYLCGRSPQQDAEPNCDNLDVDHEFFNSEVWPTLAHRVPAFESAKVVGSWAGYYEYNVYDENGIIGPHPYYNNLYVATGFSGHGIQQTPAVGRAISELILDGQYRTIDLSRLSFDRLIVDRPMYEANVF